MPGTGSSPINLQSAIMQLLTLVRKQVPEELLPIPDAPRKMKISAAMESNVSWLQLDMDHDIRVTVTAWKYPEHILVGVIDDYYGHSVGMSYSSDEPSTTDSHLHLYEEDEPFMALDVAPFLLLMRIIANALHARVRQNAILASESLSS